MEDFPVLSSSREQSLESRHPIPIRSYLSKTRIVKRRLHVPIEPTRTKWYSMPAIAPTNLLHGPAFTFGFCLFGVVPGVQPTQTLAPSYQVVIEPIS